jgi:hypothetical protein
MAIASNAKCLQAAAGLNALPGGPPWKALFTCEIRLTALIIHYRNSLNLSEQAGHFTGCYALLSK